MPRTNDRPVLIVHGGAGPRPVDADASADGAIAADLAGAVAAGLECGADDAIEIVATAVAHLEDCEAFNAGTGSALAADGGVWCDAAVMSADGRAGAVAAVRGIANPVRAAQALLESGGPVLWAGHSEALAARCGLPLVDPVRMVTERQRRRLAVRLAADGAGAHGTVGAVCLDVRGGLAAATSTGGYAGKPPARVGDSPILGAGTWASPECAISATGDGEAFLRTLFAHAVQARVAAGADLDAAARAALEAVRAAGGLGGAICVDGSGRVSVARTAAVLYHARS